MRHVRKVKGRQCSGQQSTLRKSGGGRFWSGGRVIRVDSRGTTFQVGHKEENKIIRQVKLNKSEEQAIKPYFLSIKQEHACLFDKINAMGDAVGDSAKLTVDW